MSAAYQESPERDCAQATIIAPFSRNPLTRLNTRQRKIHIPRSSKLNSTFNCHLESYTTHRSTQQPVQNPAFIDLFFLLPPEIRNYIYRLLLVRPLKFDLYHNRPCQQIAVPYTGPDPAQDADEESISLHWCARCDTRTQILDESSTRSKWSQPRLNPFLCDRCHWDQIGRKRERLEPPVEQLKCLCTRRQNLEILLINRRFHREAAFVFWTENWFGFEHHGLLMGFISALRPHIRALVRKVTFLPDHYILPDWMPSQAWWKSLKQCPELQILELDASCLLSKQCVLSLRTLHVNERVSLMRQVQFEEWSRRDQGYPNSYIWPAQALRYNSKLPFPDMFAASLTGKVLKTKWLKRAYFES